MISVDAALTIFFLVEKIYLFTSFIPMGHYRLLLAVKKMLQTVAVMVITLPLATTGGLKLWLAGATGCEKKMLVKIFSHFFVIF